MSLASTVQVSALRALRTYGAAGTLTHVTPGVFDPATGTVASTTTVTAVRALLDQTSLKTLGFRFGEGMVQAGDMQATVAGVVPLPGDVLTLALGVFVVIDVRSDFVGDQAVMSSCLVRK